MERSLLWLGVEDYTGLWEAAWEVTKFQPELSYWDACRRAGKILSSMYALGWITVHRTREPMAGHAVRPVAEADVDATLTIGPHWQVPTTGVESVRFKTTAEGQAAYESAAGTASP